MPSCLHEEFEGDHTPRPRETGPSRSLAGIVEVQQGTGSRGPGCWLLENGKVGNSFQEATKPESGSPAQRSEGTQQRPEETGKSLLSEDCC